MRVDFKKGSHVFFFGIVIPLASLFISWIFHRAGGDKLPYWMETLSPVYVYMFIYAGFDKYAWAWFPFRWFGARFPGHVGPELGPARLRVNRDVARYIDLTGKSE